MYTANAIEMKEHVMEATILFVAVAALILLAVTSLRFGVDSRDSSAAPERWPLG
jgi:hypothetical protein